MKRILFILLTVHLSVFTSFAQQMTMKQVFTSAPDSILPLMTNVNRLDCIDFIENNMEARVKDRFQNPVILEALTSNYLRLKTSEMSMTEWKLISGKDMEGGNPTDTTQYIVVANTCSAPTSDSNVILYTTGWTKIKDIQRPSLAEFFKPECNMQSDSILSLKAEIVTLPLMTARLSPDNDTIIWTIETRELTADTKKTAATSLQSVKKKL